MKNFYDWAGELGLQLPAVSENNKRTGIRGAYPDGYVRSQYPDLYFTPIAADAPVQLQNAKKTKTVKGGADTAI